MGALQSLMTLNIRPVALYLLGLENVVLVIV
jgi:hypothetical protein